MKPARDAFTLLEVVVSCAIVAIILLATQSAIVLLAKTIPDGKTGPSARLAAQKAVDLMADDLRWATSITSDSATQITCIVPDRNGDGVAESIQYIWSGNVGDALYRQMNGAGSVSIAGNVRQFSLTYDTGTISVSGGTTTSAETLLASYTGGLLSPVTSNNLDSSNGVAQYFVPTLPSSATSWSVTRVLFYLQGIQSPGKIVTTLLTSSCGLPLSALSTYQTPQLGGTFAWNQLSLTATNLDPHSGLCVQLQGVNSKQTVNAESQSGSLLSTPAPGYLLKTGNAGATWTETQNQSLLFYIYGTYTTPNAAVSQTVLTGVRCTLQAGADSATQVVTTIPVYNQPILP